MKGVILAAGKGSRLYPFTLDCPKALVRVGGLPLIDHAIQAFVKAGIADLAIVVGHLGERIEEWVGDGSHYGARVHWVFNPDYERGNALSLHLVRPWMAEDPFILSMVDHKIDPGILTTLLSQDPSHNSLCVDYFPSPTHLENDATKVWVNDMGLITRIGKRIRKWNALDSGVFLLTTVAFSAISELLQEERAEYEIGEMVRGLVKKGHKVRACDISGLFWMDVDTVSELEALESILRENGEHNL